MARRVKETRRQKIARQQRAAQRRAVERAADRLCGAVRDAIDRGALVIAPAPPRAQGPPLEE